MQEERLTVWSYASTDVSSYPSSAFRVARPADGTEEDTERGDFGLGSLTTHEDFSTQLQASKEDRCLCAVLMRIGLQMV